MKVTQTRLDGVVIIAPAVHSDHRGWFMESYSAPKFADAGIHTVFVQDNHAFSAVKGTLRGLHYQVHPRAQAKLVRCSRGAIYDVAVDIRKGSPTYGQWVGIELTAENKKQLLIPKGFAHGYVTLTADAEIQYKVDVPYAPECDRSVLWNDPDIGIDWPFDTEPVLADKDAKAPRLKDADNNFIYGQNASGSHAESDANDTGAQLDASMSKFGEEKR